MVTAGTLRRAAFIDRDGTLITERFFLADPAGVELLPGAARALRRLKAGGFALVLVTNQSGIARGLYSLEDFLAVQVRLATLLSVEGIALDGVYYCPHHPDFGPPCDCRKPAPGLFRQAAAELRLDLRTSAYIGDRLKDVQPAATLGGRGILVRTGYGAAQEAPAADWLETVADLAEAAVRLVPDYPDATSPNPG
jgi:D-glycero-D-manno-heptose 1,7-bisphosphate phosphatase